MVATSSPVEIFCSYAQEDESWLRKLETHLSLLKRQCLISLWYDRLIVPGADWTKSIDTHLETASVILLLVSANFLASDYCYGVEMKRALERQEAGEARVVPILMCPVDWTGAPFAHLQALPTDAKPISSSRDTDRTLADVAAGIRRVIAEELPQLSASAPRAALPAIWEASSVSHQMARHDCYSNLHRPTHYIKRTEVISELRKNLIGEVSRVQPVALHGMGGAGKSVIARALCEDPLVKAAFPDGILSVSLGKEPRFLARMHTWINCLGGTITENVPTRENLRQLLMNLLQHCQCLLILDDVWKHTDAKQFLVGGKRCQVLLMTRDAAIAEELGALTHTLPLMTPPEAIRLLEIWAGERFADTDPVVKEQIVKRLGYLPLALKLAGAQLQRKAPDEWLRDFHIHKMRSRRPETIHDDLTLTFELSLEELDKEIRSLYTALAIFREDEATAQVGIERLWQGLSGLDAQTTTDLLDDLASRALLDLIPSHSSRSIRLHPLLHDVIRTELGEKHLIAHEALLRAYRPTCKGPDWYTAADDGYLYDHLCYHLQAARLIDELTVLFSNHHWLHVRIQQQRYLYDGYLEDLSLVWGDAQQRALQQVEADEEPSAFIDCMRFLLISTSINSLAGNYHPELIQRALEIGLWEPNRAIKIAVKIPEEHKRVQMCRAILHTGTLNQEQRNQVQDVALKAVSAIEDGSEQARLLASLAPLLEGKQQEHVLEQAFQTILRHLEEDEDLIEDLLMLVPLLSSKQRELALEHALNIIKDFLKWDIVGYIENQIVGLSEEVDVAGNLQQQLERQLSLYHRPQLNALKILAPLLPNALLKRSFLRVLTFGDKKERARINDTFHALLPYNESWGGAYQATFAFLNKWKVEILAILAPLVSDKLRAFGLDRAFRAALAIRDKWVQALVLTTLVPLLSEEQRQLGMRRMFRVVYTLHTEDKAELLMALASQLSEEQRLQTLQHALQEARKMYYDLNGVKVLAVLMAKLPEEQRLQTLECAFQATLAIRDERERVKALTVLAPQLSSDLVKQALDGTLKVHDWWARTEIFAALAPHLPDFLLEQALRTALAPRTGQKEAEILIHLVGRLSEERLMPALEQAFSDALYRKDTEFLAMLIPCLPPSFLEQALQVILMRWEEDIWDELLSKMAPLLPDHLFKQAIERSLSVRYWWKGVRLRTALASRLSSDLLTSTFQEALTLANKHERTKVLTALAPWLQGEQRIRAVERAFQTIMTIEDEDIRAELLIALIPLLSEQQQPSALEQAMRDVRVLQDLVSFDESWDSPELARSTTEKRAVLITTLAQLFPIQQRIPVLKEAVDAISQLPYGKKRADLLIALAPLIPTDWIEYSLQRAPSRAKNEQILAFLKLSLLTHQNQPQLLRQIRKGIVRVLPSFKDQSRQHVLLTACSQDLFFSSLFSSEIRSAIVSCIIEIREQWQWL